MQLEDLVLICISDYAGQVRGKGVPLRELPARVEGGMGLAPTNLMINTFGDIPESPWGSRGELLMIPDTTTEVALDLGSERPPERFVMADIVELDGTPWACCPRNWLRQALAALEREAGLRVYAAFEHEFHYSGGCARLGDSYALDAMRLQGTFGQALIHALRENGVVPDSFLPEYGPRQFEVTCKPAIGMAAADQAIKVREITRATARHYGERACFSPVMKPGAVGNGVHIHFSLRDRDGRPVGYDPEMDSGIGKQAGSFVAGILRHMRALLALTAPSAISYQRLQPHRWSATYNNLGIRDREAGVRLCPLSLRPGTDPAAAFNFEFRAADAAASPYLVLGGLVWAGLQGLKEALPTPTATSQDPDEMSANERQSLGLVRLPQSLDQALAALAADQVASDWFPPEFLSAYLMHKRGEFEGVKDLDPEEQCRRYAEVY